MVQPIRDAQSASHDRPFFPRPCPPEELTPDRNGNRVRLLVTSGQSLWPPAVRVSERSLARLCQSGQKVYSQGARLPELPLPSLGVLQPRRLIKARSPRNQAIIMLTPPRTAPLAGLLEVVREQYREMPGLTLTK